MSPDQKQAAQEKYDFQVALAIIGAGLTNAITLLQINGPFTLWNTIVGIIILCILKAYPPAPTSDRFSRSPSGTFLNIAYAAVWSISLLTTLGVVFNMVFVLFGGSFPDTDAVHFNPFPIPVNDTFTPFNPYDFWFFLTWLAIFLVYYLFHRKRNKVRPDGYMRHNDQCVRFLKWTQGRGGQLTGCLSTATLNKGKPEYLHSTLTGMQNGQNISFTIDFGKVRVCATGMLTDEELTLQIPDDNGQIKTVRYQACIMSEYNTVIEAFKAKYPSK